MVSELDGRVCHCYPFSTKFLKVHVDTGTAIDVIYLDFAKAFDKIPHERLLYKLDKYGIRGKLLLWIRSWLNNRFQRVCLDGVRSKWAKVLIKKRAAYLS